jgi:hypothetical protein
MFRYRIRTHIDITRTTPDRDSKDELALGQQSNFNSFLQGIGLRANISWDIDPQQQDEVWQWEFYVEQEDVFRHGDDPVALLVRDLHGIPIIGNLTNTRAVYPPAIRTQGKDSNTWVEYVHTNLSA